jgi:hypothetical protein
MIHTYTEGRKQEGRIRKEEEGGGRGKKRERGSR